MKRWVRTNLRLSQSRDGHVLSSSSILKICAAVAIDNVVRNLFSKHVLNITVQVLCKKHHIVAHYTRLHDEWGMVVCIFIILCWMVFSCTSTCIIHCCLWQNVVHSTGSGTYCMIIAHILCMSLCMLAWSDSTCSRMTCRECTLWYWCSLHKMSYDSQCHTCCTRWSCSQCMYKVCIHCKNYTCWYLCHTDDMAPSHWNASAVCCWCRYNCHGTNEWRCVPCHYMLCAQHVWDV